jgi:undecaprenyl-diphosphatase
MWQAREVLRAAPLCEDFLAVVRAIQAEAVQDVSHRRVTRWLPLSERLGMNFVDASMLSFLNAFARHCDACDSLVVLAADNDLLKGGLMMALLWWVWYTADTPAHTQHRRATVLATLLGTVGGLALAVLLAFTLPFRLRPLLNPAMGFLPPHGVQPQWTVTWSAFPSDHAAMFCGLATGLCLVSRRLGYVAYSYVGLLICLPRLYLGYHYPTDIIGGAALGTLSVLVANRAVIRGDLTKPLFRWMDQHPAAFYAGFFLVSFQMAVLFDDIRAVGRLVYPVLKKWVLLQVV